MARKRSRTKRRSTSRPPARRSRRRGGSAKANLAGLMGAGLYGAARTRISQFVAPFTRNIPGGAVADELGMLAVNWAARRFIGRRVPLVADMAKAGMMIEAASIGATLAAGGLGGATGNGNGVTVIG